MSYYSIYEGGTQKTQNLFIKYYIFILTWFLKIFIFRERGREGEREGEKHQCVVASHMPPTGGTIWLTTQACGLTGNWTGNPLVHSPVFNPLSHTSQVFSHVLTSVTFKVLSIWHNTPIETFFPLLKTVSELINSDAF